MHLKITDRVLTAIAQGCELKVLRLGLADIPAEPLDYALRGLREAGKVTIVDGFIAPLRITPPAPQPPRVPDPVGLSTRNPWAVLAAMQKDLG